MSLSLELPPQGTLQPNNEHDPLPYYYHRWVGWLYRHRLQMGLNLLPAGGRRVLEVGVGSGVLVPTLSRHYQQYVGCDLELAAGLERLVAPGCRGQFCAADLLRTETLPAGPFDAIICFSVLEHIRDSAAAARNLASMLASGGSLVAGYPLVSPAMSRAFRLLGYRHIDEHHVRTASEIEAALGAVLHRADRAAFPPGAPPAAALYQCTRWTRRP